MRRRNPESMRHSDDKFLVVDGKLVEPELRGYIEWDAHDDAHLIVGGKPTKWVKGFISKRYQNPQRDAVVLYTSGPDKSKPHARQYDHVEYAAGVSRKVNGRQEVFLGIVVRDNPYAKSRTKAAVSEKWAEETAQEIASKFVTKR